MLVAVVLALLAIADAAPALVHADPSPSLARPVAAASATAQHQRIVAGYGKLPLRFEPNVGQAAAPVQYLARGGGYSLVLTAHGAVLAPGGGASGRTHAQPAQSRIGINLVGGRAQPQIVAEQRQASYSNYFVGNDPSKWCTKVANYAAVRYRQVYPGIDWLVYGNPRQLEYDFVVAPHADPSRIALEIAGAASLAVDGRGDLHMQTSGLDFRQLRPVAYQFGTGGERQPVDSRYVLKGQRLAFVLGPYDHSRPLVIDPVLSYSTYLGGSGTDYGFALAVDSAGDAYIAGATTSIDFPTASPYQGSNPATSHSGFTAFVAKLNSAGTALAYSTYLGGSVGDEAYAVAVDGTGAAYVGGSAGSKDFPTVNPFQDTNRGHGGTGFISKLDPSGSMLLYSTYLGGTDFAIVEGLAVDGNGDAYATGYTTSTDFPLHNAVQPGFQNGGSGAYQDAFVTELNPAGNAVVYSTFLGGGGTNPACESCEFATMASGITVDAAGSAYVVGQTDATAFPLVKPFQSQILGTDSFSTNNAAFVTKFAAGGRSLAYSTYLGGSHNDSAAGDFAAGVAVDGAGNAYVTGVTQSTVFPTLNAIQPAFAGDPAVDYDAFVTVFDPSGTALVYSTYLDGNSGSSGGKSIAVDGAGNAYVVGPTTATDFPMATPFQGVNAGGGDLFVAEIGAGGTALLLSSYLGGSGTDSSAGIGLDGAGNLYVAGYTSSQDFPTIAALQPGNAGSGDVFVSKIGAGSPPPAPAGLTASAGDAQVGLRWSAAPGAASYKVYQGTSPGGEASAPVLSGVTGTSATVTGLVNGTIYYFEVVAVSPGASSAPSNEASATPGAPGPILSIDGRAGHHEVRLKWSPAANATGYTVYSGTAAGQEQPLASGVTTPYYATTGLAEGVNYYFRVAGTNADGAGPESAEIELKTQ